MNTHNTEASAEIVVGTTGHRVLAEPDRVRLGVEAALNRIVQEFPGRSITILSSLAEGADRLVVHQVLAHSGAKLIAILPLPKSRYLEDFTTAESKQEFARLLDRAEKVIELPLTSSAEEGYESSGKYIVDHSEVLVTIWDGQPEQGRGGTGAIVKLGRERGLPLAWVHAGNRKPGTSEATTLGVQQGQVSCERFKSSASGVPMTSHSEALRTVVSSAKPMSDDSEGVLLQAQGRHDDKANKLRKKRFTFGIVAIALGPVAVCLLVTQTLAFSEDRNTALVLIGLELLLLAWALGISFLSVGSSHKAWIRERLRSEILRREQFLILARIGPYLDAPPATFAKVLRERIALIENEDKDPFSMLSMGDGSASWRDRLEDAKAAGKLPELADLSTKIQTYIEERVSSQRKWFFSKSRSHGNYSRNLENSAKLILAFALIFAAFHFGLLVAGAKVEGAPWHVLLMVIAISLPAFGGAVVGLHSLLGSERLSRSYLQHARTLESMEDSLKRLQSQCDLPEAPGVSEIQFQFMRIVLSVEELLSHELRLWWHVMHSAEPRAGA